MKVKSLSRIQLLVTPWTAAHQAPPSMGFARQESWSGLPLQYIKFGSKLYTNRGQIENHFLGDYDANYGKLVHSSPGRDIVTTPGQVQDAAPGQRPRGDVTDLNRVLARPRCASQLNSRSFRFLIHGLRMTRSSLPLPRGMLLGSSKTARWRHSV